MAMAIHDEMNSEYTSVPPPLSPAARFPAHPAAADDSPGKSNILTMILRNVV